MKKLSLIFMTLILSLAVHTSLMAMPIQNIEEQKAINSDLAQQAQLQNDKLKNDYMEKFNDLSTRYMDNIQNCKPIHVNEYMDIFGLKFSLKFDINGWVDNKCQYFMSANIGGIGNDIREVFNINLKDESIAKFEPKIKCGFTKEDLAVITEMIKVRAEQNKQLITDMLNNPQAEIKVNEKKMTQQEEKLVKMLTNGTSCTIVNLDELMTQFTSIMEEL